jgi:hypothetical protein
MKTMTIKNWNLKTMETENKKRYKEHGTRNTVKYKVQAEACSLVHLSTRPL